MTLTNTTLLLIKKIEMNKTFVTITKILFLFVKKSTLKRIPVTTDNVTLNYPSIARTVPIHGRTLLQKPNLVV